MAKFKVLREHIGDKEYKAGDTRTANAADVKRLVDLGVLAPIGSSKPKSAAKAAGAAPANKAQGAAPANKAEGGSKATK